MEDMKKTNGKTPGMLFSAITLALVVATLVAGILVFNMDEHILLICCICIMAFACVILGYKWSEIEESMIKGVTKALPGRAYSSTDTSGDGQTF